VSLLTHVLSVMLATNSTIAAVSNEVQAATGLSLPLVDPNDPAERALHQIMLDDDAAMESVAQSIQLNQTSATNGAAATPEQVKQGLRARLDIVRKEYEEFLKKFPDSARGHLAYGTFLNDIGEEYEGSVEYEKSRQLDPKNPAVWNDLANYYGENSPVTNAFAYYAKAIELDPAESVYYQNLATTVYLFRHDATNFYGITEAEVFDKSLALYRQAMALDPGNLPLATDYAQSFYEIHPLRTNDALVAWTNALALTHTETEREGVYVHLARLKIGIGRYDEARAHLAAITNADLLGIRHRLERNLADKEHPGTNAPPADAGD
jgi:tetratricopeptide (TPR) repeat protein